MSIGSEERKTQKFIERLKGIISAQKREMDELKKRLSSVNVLEAKIVELDAEKHAALAAVQSAKIDMDLAKEGLRQTRLQIGILDEENKKLQSDLDLARRLAESNLRLANGASDRATKLEQRIRELEASERDLRQLRARVRRSNEEARVLAQELREKHGAGPQAGQTLPRLTQAEALAKIPEGGTIDYIDAESGQMVRTGRMISKESNLQEIPHEEDYGTKTGRFSAADGPLYSNLPPKGHP